MRTPRFLNTLLNYQPLSKRNVKRRYVIVNSVFFFYFSHCCFASFFFQLKVVDDLVGYAKQDLESLFEQRDNFETNVRVNMNTTMADIQRRFPDIARSNEDEINQMLWFYNKEKTREARENAQEDNDHAHCKHDDTKFAGDYGYVWKTGCVPEVEGEDSYVAKNVKQYTARVGPEPQQSTDCLNCNLSA